MHFVITFAHMTPAAETGNRIGFMGILEKKSYWWVISPLYIFISHYSNVEGRFSHSVNSVNAIHLFGGRGLFSHYVETILQKLLRAPMHASAVRIVANISHLENLREIARLRLIC